MIRRQWLCAVGLTAALLAAPWAQAQTTAADAFVRQVTGTVMDTAKADKSIRNGDIAKIRDLVDAKLMPHVDFERMTAMSVGPKWRSATAEQKKRMLDEFKTLMIHTYAGALTQVRDQTVEVKPLRGAADRDDVVVKTEVRGDGEPIQLDYRLEKAGSSWKIYDVNVGGFWLVEAYRGQFARDLNAGGLDALIGKLADKNANAKATAGAGKS